MSIEALLEKLLERDNKERERQDKTLEITLRLLGVSEDLKKGLVDLRLRVVEIERRLGPENPVDVGDLREIST